MLRLRDKVWDTGKRTYIMGILNLTPDSFSDGGLFAEKSAAVFCAREMMADSADIIDIGGQSTRPGSVIISADEEWNRIETVVNVLGQEGIPFSVDTFYPSVARLCLQNGALMINDVSGKVSQEMAWVIKEFGAAWVLMHNRDITGENNCCSTVRSELVKLAQEAESSGVAREQICLDPGIGFGKTNQQSVELIKNTESVKPAEYTYLVAASRKRCIGEISGIDVPRDRDAATAVAHAAAIAGGADIIRVHNVKMAHGAALAADELFRR